MALSRSWTSLPLAVLPLLISRPLLSLPVRELDFSTPDVACRRHLRRAKHDCMPFSAPARRMCIIIIIFFVLSVARAQHLLCRSRTEVTMCLIMPALTGSASASWHGSQTAPNSDNGKVNRQVRGYRQIGPWTSQFCCQRFSTGRRRWRWSTLSWGKVVMEAK